jgi:hypothetical protein
MAFAASLQGQNSQIKTSLVSLTEGVADYVWDASRARIYAVTWSGRVSIINPATAQVEDSFPTKEYGSQLQVSGDGRYLYEVSQSRNAIHRYDLSARAMDLEIPFAPSAISFVALPGEPQSVVVA